MKTSDYIVQFLVRRNIKHIFGYIGGMVTHIVDSIYTNPNLEMVNTINEQGAGFAAEAYARVKGGVSVALATSGPGATNLLTPLASCYFDSTPTVFITGQVNTFEYRKFPNIRQCGFQETNIVGMAKPVTKYAVFVDRVENLRYELEKCFYIAENGRKGPVLIDIPMNIQNADFNFESARSFYSEVPTCKPTLKNKILLTKAMLLNSKRPLVLLGNGTRLSGNVSKVKSFIRQTQIPVVCSLLGLDVVDSNYKYNLGLIGTYGHRSANLAMTMADVLLVLGSRLDIRQIGAKLDVFKDVKIIQVDIDNAELACDNISKLCIECDINKFISYFSDFKLEKSISSWQTKVFSLKERFVPEKNIDGTPLVANEIVCLISQNLKEDDIVCADVGQHQLWVGQSLKIKEQTRVLFSGGLGAMGFALPAAIGAAIAHKRAIVIAGDGGFQMNIQELEIIKRRNLPVKIIVMNNQSLSMVKQFQDTYFDGRHPSTVLDYSAPDFAQVAKSYGIKGTHISDKEITPDFLKDFLSNDEPALLNIYLNPLSALCPKVLFGNAIDRQYPLLDENEFKKIKEFNDD